MQITRIDRRAALGALAGVAGAIAWPAQAQPQAQAFPAKPVRLLVGSPAGGGGDTIARLITNAAAPLLGQGFVIENRAGAGGNIAADLVAKSPADGYTLLLAFTGHVLNPSLYRKLSFDTQQDFAPVIRLARNQTMLVVRPGLAASSVRELLALARAQPGRVSLAALTGSSQHLAGELLKSMAGVELLTVPYKGNAAALNDVMGGQVDAMFSTVTIAGPFVRNGKLRALAVTGPTRSSLFPEVPTVAESGVSGFVTEGWYGVLAPAGTPRAIVDQLYKAFDGALAQPAVRQALAAGGNEPAVLAPSDFRQFIQAEIPRWADVIRRARIEQE